MYSCPHSVLYALTSPYHLPFRFVQISNRKLINFWHDGVNVPQFQWCDQIYRHHHQHHHPKRTDMSLSRFTAQSNLLLTFHPTAYRRQCTEMCPPHYRCSHSNKIKWPILPIECVIEQICLNHQYNTACNKLSIVDWARLLFTCITVGSWSTIW